MFYLTKRVDEKQCTVGEAVMVIADFSGVPAGTKGVIVEIYDEGVSVAWAGLRSSRMSILNTVETIQDRVRLGNSDKITPSQGWAVDGFSRDELEYLAFATAKHPKVDPKVYSAVNF